MVEFYGTVSSIRVRRLSVPSGLQKKCVVFQICYTLYMEWIFYSLPIATFATMTIRWWFYDYYPNMRSVYAQWDIPDSLPPVEVGYIMVKKIHRRDLSGLIVDLVLRGYISMQETMIPMKIDSRIDFKFVRSPDTSQHQLLPYEKLFIQALFQQGNTVFLSGFGAEFFIKRKGDESPVPWEILSVSNETQSSVT